jgi:hypothetical protein
VAVVIATLSGAAKKPRSTLNRVSATKPRNPPLFSAPGVAASK